MRGDNQHPFRRGLPKLVLADEPPHSTRNEHHRGQSAQAARRTRKRTGESERQVATLGPGDVFGEMALLTDEPRNATVRAVEDMEAFGLGKKDFRDALERSVGFREQIRQIYFDRYPVLRKASA